MGRQPGQKGTLQSQYKTMSASFLVCLLASYLVTTSLSLSSLSPCCPEFPTSEQCPSLCRLSKGIQALEQSVNVILGELEGGRLRMLQARSAPDKEMEESLLGSLKEAFVLIENCAQFNICNGARAVQISGGINNIGELFVSHSLTNFSSGFPEDLHLAFGLIQSAVSRAREGSSQCPPWILSLGLQDSLTGSLCILFGEQSGLSSSEDRLTDCSEEYLPLVQSLHSVAVTHLQNRSAVLTDPQDSFIQLVITRSCTNLDSATWPVTETMQEIKESILQKLQLVQTQIPQP